MGIEVVEGAELADQPGGRLLPHSGHAGDVVGRVALEGFVVDHLASHQAIAVGNLRGVVDDRVLHARAGGHQTRLVRHQLQHVEIDRDDRRLEVVRLGLNDQRADDVVGLVALQLVMRDAQRPDNLADLRELVAQVVGHAGARRLVLGVLLVPERRPGQVESDRDVIGLEVGKSAQDNRTEAENAVDELPAGRRQWWQCIVSAVHEPEAVEQHQAFHGQASKGSISACPVYLRSRPGPAGSGSSADASGESRGGRNLRRRRGGERSSGSGRGPVRPRLRARTRKRGEASRGRVRC